MVFKDQYWQIRRLLYCTGSSNLVPSIQFRPQDFACRSRPASCTLRRSLRSWVSQPLCGCWWECLEPQGEAAKLCKTQPSRLTSRMHLNAVALGIHVKIERLEQSWRREGNGNHFFQGRWKCIMLRDRKESNPDIEIELSRCVMYMHRYRYE